MTAALKRSGWALLMLIINWVLVFQPLLKMGQLYSNKASAFQSLSEYFPACSYGVWASDNRWMSIILFVVAGCMMALQVAVGAAICSNSGNSTLTKFKPSRLFAVISTFVGSVICFVMSWIYHDKSRKEHSSALNWSHGSADSERVTELSHKVSDAFVSLSHYHMWWTILTFAYGCFLFWMFLSIVKALEAKDDSNMNKVQKA